MPRYFLAAVFAMIATAAISDEKPQLANPSAVHCIKMGGKYEFRTADGARVALLHLTRWNRNERLEIVPSRAAGLTGHG